MVKSLRSEAIRDYRQETASCVMFFRGLFTIIAVLPGHLSASDGAQDACIRDYHSLESELADNDLNLDSLTRSFFPPNAPSVPVVEVFYTISNSSDPNQHPLILEMQGSLNETELAILAKYRYRWSKTPMYLFMDPNVLEKLALFTIRVRSSPARLLITKPFCENYTINGIPLPEYHLNQMTSLVCLFINSWNV